LFLKEKISKHQIQITINQEKIVYTNASELLNGVTIIHNNITFEFKRMMN